MSDHAVASSLKHFNECEAGVVNAQRIRSGQRMALRLLILDVRWNGSMNAYQKIPGECLQGT